MSTIVTMRGFLASSIGVTCAAALALPLAPPAVAATVARQAPTAEAAVAGSTQSLPLVPLAADRVLGSAAGQGLPPQEVAPFSMLGVVWDNPDAELHGQVQVRTRSARTGAWSDWQDVETHYADDAPDPGAAERASGRVRGATAPLWVGASDAVEVRVRPERAGLPQDHDDEADGSGRALSPAGTAQPAAGRAASSESLPSGLRVELIDPGRAPAAGTSAESGALEPGAPGSGALDGSAALPAVLADHAPVGGPRAGAKGVAAARGEGADAGPSGPEIPELDREDTERELLELRGEAATDAQRAKPYIGPRPAIVTRRGWGADEKLREKKFVYTGKVKAAFVHHTATGNNYTCAQAPSVIRGIYRYHVRSMGWRDIGYNFLVDKCGKIYEGRAGGVAKPVLGAHTLGFNTNTTGIAVIGSHGSKKPSASAVTAVAKLTAWKLGLHGANPRGKTTLTSGGGNLYRKGKNVRLNVISGHRDGFATACPGQQLYGKLGSARTKAAELQGR